MIEFTHNDNKVAIFCNNSIIKYLQYFTFKLKRFTTVVI